MKTDVCLDDNSQATSTYPVDNAASDVDHQPTEFRWKKFIQPPIEQPNIRLYDQELEPNPESLIKRQYAVALLGITDNALSEYIESRYIVRDSREAILDKDGSIEYVDLFRAEHVYLLRRNINPSKARGLLSISEVSQILDLSQRMIRNLVDLGRILPAKTVPFGNTKRTLFFDAGDITQYAEFRKSHPTRRGRPRELPPEPIPSVQEAKRRLARVQGDKVS